MGWRHHWSVQEADFKMVRVNGERCRNMLTSYIFPNLNELSLDDLWLQSNLKIALFHLFRLNEKLICLRGHAI